MEYITTKDSLWMDLWKLSIRCKCVFAIFLLYKIVKVKLSWAFKTEELYPRVSYFLDKKAHINSKYINEISLSQFSYLS
jgi:hypothetical protein